jgi:hypothetical protein
MNTTSIAIRGLTTVRAIRSHVKGYLPFLNNVIFIILELPLMQLYLQGPAFGGYGFWQNTEPAVICERITNVQHNHWENNLNVCSDLIYQRFASFMLLLYVGMYICTIITLYCVCVFRMIKCKLKCLLCCERRTK